jgi:hypothetical protein
MPFFMVFGLLAAAMLQAQASGSEQADALVKRYCLGCHNEKLKTGGLSLTGLNAAAVGTHAGIWEKVLRKTRSSEMPPPRLPKPDPLARDSFVSWLESRLESAAQTNPNPGAPAIHRLNRAEYSNAVRDLLALDLDHSSSLPADDAGYGFDNIGDVLTISPLHMEKYMAAARRVSRLAVGTFRSKPAVERYDAIRGAGDGLNELPLNVRGGIAIRHHFPVDAEYSVLVRVRGTPPSNAPLPQLDLRLDGKRVKLFDVSIDPAEEAQLTRNYEFKLPVTAGAHEVGAGFLNESWKREGGGPPPRRSGQRPPPALPPSVDYVLIGGPFDATGPGETESRKRIFVCRPGAGIGEEHCATRIITSLARRAYRRPVGQTDIAPLMKLFAAGRKDGGGFEYGIEMALRAILVSPNFLFRAERAPENVAPGSVYEVSDLELASRLSFFLWSSIPDEALLRLAEQRKLRVPSVLNQQVRRMLADPKSKSLVDNFAGQWLHLRNVADWSPDPDRYPDFDEALQSALARETELFFANIVHEDRSILEFLDADYTYLNERLARHYQIPGVRGGYFRRVALNSSERGGVLTHGSVLTVTSYPTRTSPVLRGKWILENVLGSPPPPPPPDVPTLADEAGQSAKSLREQLEKHRADAACASCHARLDPLGFALENYDATGKFRKSDGGVEIDSSGSLPDGATVRGPGDLKKVMMDRKDEFVDCFSEKLLTYALGRGLEHYDLPAVRGIRREAERNNYRFSSVALAIVNSVPFRMRRNPGR